jgi:hypothetical protein
VSDDVDRQEPLLNDLIAGDSRHGGELVKFGAVPFRVAGAVPHDVYDGSSGGRQVTWRAVARQVEGLVQAHHRRRVGPAQPEVQAGTSDGRTELRPAWVDRQQLPGRGWAASGDHDRGSRQQPAVGQCHLPSARDGADADGGLVLPDGGASRRRCRREAIHEACESLIEVGDAPAGALDPEDCEVGWHGPEVGHVGGHSYQHPGQVRQVMPSPQRLDPFFGTPARPSRSRCREQPGEQPAHLAYRHSCQLAVAHHAGATQRRPVTRVGYPQVAQYPPGLAALAESVRPLVKPVAAPFVGAGPASRAVCLHHDHRPPRPSGGCSRRQPRQPRPDHHHSFPDMFSHAHMTPPHTLL